MLHFVVLSIRCIQQLGRYLDGGKPRCTIKTLLYLFLSPPLVCGCLVMRLMRYYCKHSSLSMRKRGRRVGGNIATVTACERSVRWFKRLNSGAAYTYHSQSRQGRKWYVTWKISLIAGSVVRFLDQGKRECQIESRGSGIHKSLWRRSRSIRPRHRDSRIHSPSSYENHLGPGQAWFDVPLPRQ